jgi:hypothetical protein
MKNKRIISTITAAACAVCIALSSGNMFSVEAEGIAGNTANVKASGTTSICIYNDASIKLNTVNGNSCNFEITSTYLNSEGNPTPVNITVNGAVVKNNGIVNVSGAKGTPIDLTVGDNSKIEVKAPASKLKTVSNDDLSLQSTETIFLTSDEVSQLCNSLYIEKYGSSSTLVGNRNDE